jgi:hypothetical protein
LGGFRYVGMTDSLTIAERGLVIRDFPNNGPVVGDSFALTDSFKTRNQFYGGQLGARAEIAWGKFVIDMRGKCALGSTTQVVDVNGSTVINNDPPLPGGLLTQASNIGRYRQSRFAVVPEGAVNVGYQVTDWWRVYVGYTFLYWSSVVRPGQQIDANVNGSQLPRLAGGVDYNRNQSPKVPLKTTDFWAQGINFGMELRF